MELYKQYLVKQRVRHYCSENFINSLKITFLLIPWWSSGFFKRLLKKLISSVRLFVTPWAVAYQAPLSMGFSRQEYWGGLSFPSPGDLPDPGIESRFPKLQANALPSEPQHSSSLRLQFSTGGLGLIPGQGTKTLQAVRPIK